MKPIIEWKAFFLENSLRQGPSFLILLLLLYGLWGFSDYVIKEGIPSHLQQIQAGYKEIQTSHDKNLDRVIANSERNQEIMTEAVDEIRMAVEKLEGTGHGGT